MRNGTFSNSLEEWAEAALLVEWITNKSILPLSSISDLINSHEYIGALSDFTGEIGRLAVARASQRDFDAVSTIQGVDSAIACGLMQCNVGGRYNKKVEAVLTNYKKVEDVVYELSLLQRGGKALKRDVQPVASGGGDDDNNE